MIDFANGAWFKLSPTNPQEIVPAVAPILVPDEEIVTVYKAMRAPPVDPIPGFVRMILGFVTVAGSLLTGAAIVLSFDRTEEED
jgi:hypothetical protein